MMAAVMLTAPVVPIDQTRRCSPNDLADCQAQNIIACIIARLCAMNGDIDQALAMFLLVATRSRRWVRDPLPLDGKSLARTGSARSVSASKPSSFSGGVFCRRRPLRLEAIATAPEVLYVALGCYEPLPTSYEVLGPLCEVVSVSYGTPRKHLCHGITMNGRIISLSSCSTM